MHLLFFLTFFLPLVHALPTAQPETSAEGINLALLQRDTATLSGRQFIDTRNELVSGPCKAVTVIFARGTTESGNVGIFAGPPFFNALATQIGSSQLAVQGVDDYPADVVGYLIGGSPSGASRMAQLIRLAISKCPSTKIVISGYSQGAQVTHLGADKLSAAEGAKIAAVVVFGDPYNGDAFKVIPSSKVKTFCHVGDLICLGQPIVLPPHLTYSVDATAAAAFVKSKI